MNKRIRARQRKVFWRNNWDMIVGYFLLGLGLGFMVGWLFFGLVK